MIKNTFLYVERVFFVLYKLRQNLLYSFAFKNKRNANYKIREVAHSIDKSMQLKCKDEKRGCAARKRLKKITSEVENISEDNLALISWLNGEKNKDGFDCNVFLPTVRRFSSRKIEDEVISSSVYKGNRYPKSCSRDATKIYKVKSCKALVAQCFSGFTCIEGEYEIAVIVVDLTAYDQRSEIFAPYIDASIFSTGFCSGLWDRGVGSCMLNWSSQNKKSEKKLRDILKLKNEEVIVMGIALGYPEYIPFHAPRKRTNEILRFI